MGSFVSRTQVSFGLLPPVDQFNSIFDLDKSKIQANGCVLPGLDPRAEVEKECQDSFTFLSSEGQFLAILFDGHGKDGRRVSLFCRDFMKKYFEINSEAFEVDPKLAIEDMVDQCDFDLASSGIECNLSGTTAVVIVINSLGIHAGSVGDSRAVLASVPKDNSLSFPEYRASQFKRLVQPSRNLNALPLTVDQKPNHEEELRRIKAAGGVVEKLADEMGRPVGPYRVWKKKGNLPGLAMSRSIGDRLAHDIGVISTPIFHSFSFYPGFDQFIVLASDGIWDVMDNFEVINFVEKFRKNCQGESGCYPARLSNSTISRLLCEEARFRWFGVIEEEDVMIDDISCIVIEFSALEAKMLDVKAEERKVNKFKSIAIDSSETSAESSKAVRKDPTRGSVANDSEISAALKELNN
jgi:serine/threonine protein phosphatase PrpC